MYPARTFPSARHRRATKVRRDCVDSQLGDGNFILDLSTCVRSLWLPCSNRVSATHLTWEDEASHLDRFDAYSHLVRRHIVFKVGPSRCDKTNS